MVRIVLLSLLSFSFFLISCDKDVDNDIVPAVYSPSENVEFSKINFFIKPYIENSGLKKYLLTDTLYNVMVQIDGQKNFSSQSFQLDTLHIPNKETISYYRVTSQEVKYPVIVNVRILPDKFETAGEYAHLLNNYFELAPGDYIFQIKSFDIQTIYGKLLTIHTPLISAPLEVRDQMKSAFLGEFEVAIDL